MRNDAGVLTGNISREATTLSINNFAEAMRRTTTRLASHSRVGDHTSLSRNGHDAVDRPLKYEFAGTPSRVLLIRSQFEEVHRRHGGDA